MAGEIRQATELTVKIIQRILQVHGNLLEYNPLEDKNMDRAKDVFLCLDQIGNHKYMLNIVDATQKISFTRKELTNVCDFQINQKDQGINFIGNSRSNNYIPGYLFKVHAIADFKNLKNILARCMFESQNNQAVEKADDFDEDYLAQQMLGDMVDDDVNMADDFDFKPAPPRE